MIPKLIARFWRWRQRSHEAEAETHGRALTLALLRMDWEMVPEFRYCLTIATRRAHEAAQEARHWERLA